MCCIQEPGLGFGSRELKAGNWKYVLRQERRVGGLGGGWWMVDGGATLESRVVKKCGRLVAGIRRECRNWFVREG